eukprot:scaffold133109_cov45-Attheya_sp.AAC.1
MPIQDPADEMKFVSPKEAHSMVDEGMTLAEQMKSLPVLREQSTEKRLLSEAKARDKSHGGMVGLWHSSKARGVAYCSECAAPRAVYSKFIIDDTKRGEPEDRENPNKSDYNKMKCRIEGGGYMCGELLEVPFYHVKEAHTCNDPVEPQYYSTNDTRGGSAHKERGITVVTSSAAAVNQKRKREEEKKDKETRRNKAMAAGGKKASRVWWQQLRPEHN